MPEIYLYEIDGKVKATRDQIQKFLNGVGKLIKELEIEEVREIGATYK